jgi:hypothetical protein
MLFMPRQLSSSPPRPEGRGHPTVTAIPLFKSNVMQHVHVNTLLDNSTHFDTLQPSIASFGFQSLTNIHWKSGVFQQP